MWELDHLAVAAETLDEGVSYLQAAMGVALSSGGRHAHMATHNRVLGLGPKDYLEVIAIDPQAEPVPHPRWFRLDEFRGRPRLTNWICRVPDLAKALAMAPSAAGTAVDLARGDYRWRMAVPANGRLPYGDCFPALIEWAGVRPQDRLPDVNCRLIRLEVAHPDADILRDLVPLRDQRVVFVAGAVALRATLATPRGLCVLE